MDEIKIGDLVSTYHKGYHEVVAIKGNILSYRQKYTAEGKALNGKLLKSCHIGYCSKAGDHIRNKTEIAIQNLTRLENLLIKLNCT